MKDSIFFVTIVIIAIGFIFGFALGSKDGYKMGQVDSINGKIKYELVIKPDKTSTWERIKK